MLYAKCIQLWVSVVIKLVSLKMQCNKKECWLLGCLLLWKWLCQHARNTLSMSTRMLMWINNFWDWTAWLGAWCQSSISPWKLSSSRHPNTIYSHLTSVSISKLAPACKSNSATWTWPSWQAAWNGVHPSLGKGMTNMQVSNDTYVRSSRQGFTRLYRKYD